MELIDINTSIWDFKGCIHINMRRASVIIAQSQWIQNDILPTELGDPQ